jgi:hypothetical protein
VTPAASRRFRFFIFALCWLAAAALQTYASDVGTHGAIVGAYVPAWLLAVAAIPAWSLLVPALANAALALAAARFSDATMRTLTAVNAVALIAYAFVGIAVIFYVAFANNGIS